MAWVQATQDTPGSFGNWNGEGYDYYIDQPADSPTYNSAQPMMPGSVEGGVTNFIANPLYNPNAAADVSAAQSKLQAAGDSTDWNAYNLASQDVQSAMGQTRATGMSGTGAQYTQTLNNLMTQLGITPNQFNSEIQPGLTGSTPQDTINALAKYKGIDPAQLAPYVSQLNSQWQGYQGEQTALNADHGLSTFLMLLAAGVGGGALMAGGLGAGVGANAAGAMGIEGAGGALGGMGGMDVAGLGAAMDSSVVGSAVPGFDLAGAGMYPLSGAAGSITTAPTFTGGLEGLGGSGGSMTGTENLADMYGGPTAQNQSLLQQIQSLTGSMPPGSSTILQKALGALMGGGATGGGTGGTSSGLVPTGGGGMGDIANWIGGGQTGGLTNLINGIMTNNAYGDQTDFLKNTMERAISASDPYGYGDYRKYAADKLQQTYQDPSAIWQSPEMQAMDKMFMDKTMASQAAGGQLFNAPERLAQRENNFMAGLKDYRQPLMQMSGSQFRPDTSAYSAFANPIVANELAKNMNQGAMVQQGGSFLSNLLGGGGAGGTAGGGDLMSLLSGMGGSGSLMNILTNGGGITGGLNFGGVDMGGSNGSWDVLPDAGGFDATGWDLGGAWGW